MSNKIVNTKVKQKNNSASFLTFFILLYFSAKAQSLNVVFCNDVE